MSERKRSLEPTNGKCGNFINANCSYNCTCEDCYVEFDPEYCPKRKEEAT